MRETEATIRVLHIPASPSLNETVGATLESSNKGIKLRTAATAKEGLKQLADTEVDCVITDYELPEWDGIELLKAVREEYPDLPVVLYTNGGSEAVASQAISSGVSEYLHPTDGERSTELVDRIESLVSTYRLEADRERERERTADLLAKTERIADVGGWELNTETNEVFWTDHLFELFGVDGDEPSLDGALDIYHEEDRSIVAEAVESALTDGESFDIEVRFRRPDGEIRWVRVQGVPAGREKAVETLRGAVQDVTERHSRERVLREMHDIISDRERSFDQQVKQLLELGRTELGAQYGTLSEIDGDDYIFEVVVADDDSIQEGEVVPVTATNCEITAKNEQTLVLGDIERDAPEETHRAGFAEWGIQYYLGAPVFVDDDVYGTFCFYDTEARTSPFSEWEQTLVDLMSRWISYELQRQQVTQQLHDQNEQLERFASIVSHDLRNPLSIIEGYVELAIETGDVSELDRVQSAVERMDTLIDDVLLLSRTENAINDRTTIDLGSLVDRCWGIVPTEQATLTVETDRRLKADKTRLTQLLENLFRNSVEHGGENVAVTVGDLADGFYVADNGPGIPEADRQQVFESGYTSAQDGTGLGLNIVAEIVEAHGWEIEITEADGGGARFEITDVQTVD